MAQQRNSKKREVIIREASRLFLTKGYAAVLVDEVATNANVSKKTLYNHFENKKALDIFFLIQNNLISSIQTSLC